MAGPMVGMAQQLTGAMFGGQVGQGVGAARRRGRHRHRRRPAARPGGHRGPGAAEHRRVRRGPRRPRRRGPALPRAARGRPPPAVRPRRRGSRARCTRAVEDYAARHHRRHRTARGARRAASTPATRPQVQSAMRRACSPPRTPRPSRPPWPGWRPLLALVEGWVDAVVDARPSTALPSRLRAARDRPPPPGHRRSGRADLRHARRPGAAPAPAARGRRALGGARRSAAAPTVATRSGSTPTCCPAPRTSTTRRRSSPAPGRWTCPASTTCRPRTPSPSDVRPLTSLPTTPPWPP